ncbi:pyrroline-5-carboxylate reductase [Helicovermis profundi]|uniref:Pyrroline-5-carboxylate reductase n=1 Tax=Helicovermis profundi TaxID=3065157 RepID=A0AAU9EA17_9FIRM|nr:pyrroline-5-carboxylate reductase [Clostridia bacterium S502]
MAKNIGIIGCGNMGGAIIGGLASSKEFNSANIIIFDRNEDKIKNYVDKYKVKKMSSMNDVAENSDYIIIAVKPNAYNVVLNDIKNKINNTKTIITIAAGISIEDVENVIGKDKKIIRTMPNTPVLVGMGMSAICPNFNVSDFEKEFVLSIFRSFGECEIIEEKLFDSVIGISGSSPAYVYMFIEALADGAVLKGMPRKMAYKFASQAVKGAANMVIQTGIHPGELKDMVCSPGGTTIEAVCELENRGFRNSIISAVDKCVEKSIKMTKLK